jgi:putative transposase
VEIMSDRVTAELIAEAVGHSPRHINRRAANERWMHEWKPVRGGRQKVYPVLPLPVEIRTPVLALLARHEAVTAAAQTAGAVTGAKLKIASLIDAKGAAAARHLGLIKFAALPESTKRKADAKAALIELAARFVKASGMAKRRGETLFCGMYSDGEIEVPAWIKEEIAGCSTGSLDNWRKKAKEEGLAGLATKYGQHRIGKGVIDTDAELSTFVKAMMVEFPHTTAKQVIRGIRARFDVERHPNFRTLQRWMAAWKIENEQLLMNMANPDGWRSKYQAAGGRADANIVRLNQRWETDSTKGDLLLADGKRHNIVGIIDVYSRRLKLHVSRSSSATAVASCLRRALLDWGVPEQLGTDNGSDFVSHFIRRAVLGLNIEQDIAPHFTPEHKPFIERSFGTFCRDLVELLPGYSGHDVTDRKAIESRKSFAQRLFKGGKGDQPIEVRLTAEELQDICDKWTDTVYGREIHSAIGCSPMERAASWSQPVQRIADERALDVLLAPAPGSGSAGGDGIRTIQKKGIKIDGGWFEAGEIGGLEGRQVRVLLDEADIGEIYVFAVDGPFIAKAVCPERLGISRADLAAGRKRHQKKVLAEGRKVMRAIAKEGDTSRIAFEILQQHEIDAGKIAFFPSAGIEHTTDALREAAIAAEHAVEAPASRVHVHVREGSTPDNVTPLRTTGGRPTFDTPEQRIRWLVENLSEVVDRDRDWIKAECRRSRFFADEYAGLISQIEEAQKASATG